jgi:hypothetical protein
VRTAQTCPDELGVLAAELTALRAELDARGAGALGMYSERFHEQIIAHTKTGTVSGDEWRHGCRDLR